MAKTTDEMILEADAIALTGYQRTALYKFRVNGLVKWTATKTGRKVRYCKKDLEKLIGL